MTSSVHLRDARARSTCMCVCVCECVHSEHSTSVPFSARRVLRDVVVCIGGALTVVLIWGGGGILLFCFSRRHCSTHIHTHTQIRLMFMQSGTVRMWRVYGHISCLNGFIGVGTENAGVYTENEFPSHTGLRVVDALRSRHAVARSSLWPFIVLCTQSKRANSHHNCNATYTQSDTHT